MTEGVLRVLVVTLGLLFIWWLCGPSGQSDRLARREDSEARESEAQVDASGR